MRKTQFYIISLWLLFPLVAIKEFVIVSHEWLFTPQGVFYFFSANIIPTCCLLLLGLGLFFYRRFTFRLKGSTRLPEKLSKVEDQSYEHLAFLTTYIIPFLRVKLEGKDLIVTVLLLIIIGAIFVKTNLFYKNPSLALLGYKLYKCDMDTEAGVILISTDILTKGQSVHTIHLADNIYFART